MHFNRPHPAGPAPRTPGICRECCCPRSPGPEREGAHCPDPRQVSGRVTLGPPRAVRDIFWTAVSQVPGAPGGQVGPRILDAPLTPVSPKAPALPAGLPPPTVAEGAPRRWKQRPPLGSTVSSQQHPGHQASRGPVLLSQFERPPVSCMLAPVS